MKNKIIILLIIIVIIAIITIGGIFIFFNNSASTEENEITESQNYGTDENWNNWEESQSTEITNKKIKYDDATLKSEFDSIFTNDIKNYNESFENKKEKSDEDIVYTGYEKNETTDHDYKVNVKIPYINLKGELIEKYNKDITKNFERVAEKILSTTGKRYIYEVDYSACIEDDILSLAIKAEIQQGDKSRLIIKTYNYNLKEDSEVSVTDVLKLKNRDLNYTQEKINIEIQKEYKKSQEYKELGYNIFERNIESDEYKVENINTFYLYDGNLYIIFAYGNKNNTLEKDIVIISDSETNESVKNTGELSQLTSENYGDYIDLGKNLVGDSTTEDDRRILYNDKEKS